MGKHIQVLELGPEASGLGTLQYTTLSSDTSNIEFDFEEKNNRNATLLLSTSKMLDIINMPNGAEGVIVVHRGPLGTEDLAFVNAVTRAGEQHSLLNPGPGSITVLRIKKYQNQIIVSSTAVSQYSGTGPGLVPSSAGVPNGSVLKKDGWGLIGRDSMSNDFNTYYLNRANHTGTQPSSTINDFSDAVRSNPLNTMAVPTGNLNMNQKRITNLADPVNPFDAVNAIYVSDAITSIETLLFNQMFS